MFVMVKCGVLFEVWAEFLNIVKVSSGFKDLRFQLYISVGVSVCTVMFTFNKTGNGVLHYVGYGIPNSAV
jgi:hypothetical protein